MKNNGFPIETKNSKQFFREHLSNLKITKTNNTINKKKISNKLEAPFYN